MATRTDGETQSPAKDSPLLIEGPKAAAADIPIIDLEAFRSGAAEGGASAKESAPETITPESASRWSIPAYAPIAATIVFAVALGAIAGAAATSSLLSDPAPAPPAAAAEATRALQASLTELGAELATLKTGIANAQRSSSAQFGKLAERLDRSEKALTEPLAKLAKIQETIDRLDHRQQAAAAPAPAPEITGSLAPPKEQARPQIAEGWRLRDFHDGRAVVENRNGMLFKIGLGSNVPGLGKVEAIKRENGRVVVVTASGIITASLEPRRPNFYYRW